VGIRGPCAKTSTVGRRPAAPARRAELTEYAADDDDALTGDGAGE
jgi:hypothetical protein